MMKLLILTQYFPPEVGAPQNRLYELAVRLQKGGMDVTVLTAMPNYPQMEIHQKYRGMKYDYEEMDGLKVHRASIHVSKNRGVAARLRNYFSFVISSYTIGKTKLEPSYDFILCESPPLFLGMSARRLCRKRNAKLILNISDLWPESAEKLGIVTNRFFLWMATKLEESLYKRAALITGQTQGIVKNISARFPQKKVYWLPNGVDTGFYMPMNTSSEWRRKNNFSAQDHLFLYAGIIGHAQGLEVILEAASQFDASEQVKFILMGDGPEKERLQRIKNEKKLDNVFFFSAVPKNQMPVIVASVDAAVIPLKKLDLFKGAIPSKIFENLAMEKPVVLGVEGEAKELFIDEAKAGLFFEPENANELAVCIRKLVSDPALVRQLGTKGRVYVKEKFERNKIAKKFQQLLENFTTE